MEKFENFYFQLYRIRYFEQLILENFPRGIFFGTTHTYLGQEANAVAVIQSLTNEDIIFSNHRCHGHFLAYGGDVRALFAELMGKATGVCGGRGGSQHLYWNNFYSNGVQGGIVPIATGMAFAEKQKRTKAIVIVFMGDGTFGQGVIYEALNMASLWNIPILYVVENNHIAQTTPVEMTLAGDIQTRFNAFNISCVELNTSDVLEIHPVAQELIANVRNTNKPHSLILNTYRFGPHSKGDDTRSSEEIKNIKLNHDPLTIHGIRLEKFVREHIEKIVQKEVISAFQQALEDPYP